jgi:hypothetical protein
VKVHCDEGVAIHELTIRSGAWQETTGLVAKLNRALRGWANYFEVPAPAGVHVAPDPCAGVREDVGEASVGERIGQPLLGRASAATAPHLPATDHPTPTGPMADPEISRFPHKERPHMPGSQTTPGPTGARNTSLAKSRASILIPVVPAKAGTQGFRSLASGSPRARGRWF